MMKKTIGIILVVLSVLLCSLPALAADDVYQIGVIQLVEHDALDAAYKGFVDGLAEAGYVDGENIAIDFQNAQGDQSNIQTIANRFVNNEVDMILAIATPAAQAVASATTDIPILVTAVTDLVSARLVESNEAPGTNVTGTSDMNPVADQIQLIKTLFPDAKTVGVIYNSSEVNSQIQAEMAKEAIEALGMKYEEGTVTGVNDIAQVAESLVKKVDAIYAPTDNTVASAIPNLIGITEAVGVPVIAGESGMVRAGALATLGLNYYNLGLQTAAMAVKVITGEAEPAAMPVEFLKESEIVINQAEADAIGYTFPEDIVNKAVEIVK